MIFSISFCIINTDFIKIILDIEKTAEKSNFCCLIKVSDSLLTSAFSVLVDRSDMVGKTVGAKFRCGKCHCFENGARIIIFAANTLFIGNTVFGRVDKILSGSDNTDYREYS